MPRKNKPGAGRPRKEVDEKLLEKLAMIQCTTPEMAACLDCSEDTLERNFAGVIKKGREQGKMSLKRKQYQLAMAGNVTMNIWLGKQHLDQRDKHDTKHEFIEPFIVEDADGKQTQMGVRRT